MEIPVGFNGEDYSSVVDTRANYSCITETYAAKVGLKILDVSIEEGSGLTGIRFKNRLGVADSIQIGNILLRNVVFLVMPDKKLDFGLFSIHIIAGYNILEQLKEIQFYKDGRMIIPAIPSVSNLHNMALNGLDPILFLQTNGNDTLCFHLDLGAQNTYLYSSYFEKYKESILRDGKSKTLKLGGAGGKAKRDAYIIPEVSLTIETKTAILKKPYVFTTKSFPSERCYGNLGQDFIRQVESFTLNFRSMYFKVNK